MKRIFIMFGVTLIIAAVLLLYNPNSKYLAVFEDSFTIENLVDDVNHTWDYKIDSSVIKLSNSGASNDNKDIKYWKFVPTRDGNANITFKYINLDTNELIHEVKYSFKVKNNKIMWTSGTSTGLYDFTNPF